MAERDPYEAEVVCRVAARAPLAFAVFLACLFLSAFFEMIRFPERRPWMAGFGLGFVVLVAFTWTLVQHRPRWSPWLMLGFVNVVGVGLNAYHAIVGAQLAMCIWTLTGLLGASAVIIPWGRSWQSLACVGALLSYPLHLAAGTDPLTWAAGGTYLLVVVSLSVFGASLFARDLRSAMQLTAALSEREARLQTYFDLSLVGTAILAPDGTCRELNDELCTMLGYERDALLGASWVVLLHPEERDAAAAVLAETLAAPQRREMQCLRKDGDVIDAIVSLRGLPGREGRVDHVMLLFQDITERKRTEARTEAARRAAEEANRAKDSFLAAVSHELRTPLTPILAWAGILSEELPAEATRRALAAIQRNAKAQERLIEDLLDVSRIVSGSWRLTLEPVALAPVVRAAVDVLRPAAEDKDVALDVAIAAEALIVRGDTERLQQIVWNLVSNAVKFTPRGGRVQVTLARDDASARVTVRDAGEGISPDFLPHVFERFRQADASSTRRHAGLGLGLAIVRALVDRHGGTVGAESPGVGRGATFTVELPLFARPRADVADDGPAAAGGNVPPHALGGLHVLVVDDDADSNEAVSALLAARGADVRTALSTPEALEIVGRWHPDVVVSDIAMPGEDGYAFLRALRARGGPVGEVPAIALTAYAGSADRSRLLAAGFHAHVPKPFDPVQLAAVVETAAHAGAKPFA
jgi:PAS domain S-box-containing protein